MILKRTKLNNLFVSLAFLILSAILFSSCESSRVGPALPTPNPPPPTQQALILNGYVKDASNQSAISGASVKIAKTDGTILITLLSDNGGKYSFDASNVTATSLNISASKAGYAFRTTVATLDKTANTASVSSILLTKLAVTTFAITAAAGGSGSTPNNQAVSGQTLGINVPPNAVPSNVQLTVASMPAGQVPQPSDPNVSVLSVGQFGPTGTIFSQPVTITFPLPYKMTPGTVFQLMQLNETTGGYINSGFTATVNADGASADAQVNHFTTYTLQSASGDIHISVGNPSSSDSPEQSVASSGNSSPSLQKSITNTITCNTTGPVNLNFVKDLIGDNITVTEGSSTQTLSFNGKALPAQYVTGNVQHGPKSGIDDSGNEDGKDHSGESGNWEYRWYYVLRTTTETGNATGPDWSANVSVTTQEWVITRQGWYWVSHDQGAVQNNGPF